jgi:hypothetical protein
MMDLFTVVRIKLSHFEIYHKKIGFCMEQL